jgi:flagellar assembly factor FliW
MKIETARFGEVEVADDRLIDFVEPVLGFEESRQYVLLDHAENSPFNWLQSVNDPDLAFVVTHPKLFGIEYEVVLSDAVMDQLSITSGEDVLVLTIVNIPADNPARMTANLMGPIVINQVLRKAMQVVLGDSDYSTKTRLVPDDTLQATTSGSSSPSFQPDREG